MILMVFVIWAILLRIHGNSVVMLERSAVILQQLANIWRLMQHPDSICEWLFYKEQHPWDKK